MAKTKPTQIMVLTSMNGAKSIAEAMAEIGRQYGRVINLKLYYVDEIEEKLADGNALPEDIASGLRDADIVWLDVRGDTSAINLIKETLSTTDNVVLGFSMATSFGSGPVWLEREQPFLVRKLTGWMGKWMEGRDMDMGKMQRMLKLAKVMGKLPSRVLREIKDRTTVLEYWQYGGRENTKNLLLYLAKVYGGQRVKADPPRKLPEPGIYHPQTLEVFASLDDYLRKYPLTKKQTVGMLFFGGLNVDDSAVGVRELMKRLEGEANLIPIYSQDFNNCKAMQDFFFRDGKPIVDLAVSFLIARMNGGFMGGDPQLTLNTLRSLDVSVLNAPPMYIGEVRRWKESEAGLSPIETITHVTLPELDGCIEPILPCGYEEECSFDRNICAPVRAMAPIPDRLDRIAGRVRGWLQLRRKGNAERRVAIIMYNYPPDESGIGAAGYLNTMESIKGLLKKLKEEGYTTEELPPGVGLDELFVRRGIVNQGEWLPPSTCAENSIVVGNNAYLKWFRKLPQEARDSMVARWGEPPGSVLTYKDKFIIPGIILRNIFIGLQPSHGGDTEEVKESLKSYHDKTLPPHHQYLAFYKWLEEEFKADVIIHFGTHGTLEFTKGKEVGMSGECFPDILMGDLPHLYVYMVSNPSEATIAKRRSYATIINHMSPSFTDSGLYDELAELEELIHEYHEAKSQDPNRARMVYDQIQTKAKEAHFSSESIDEIYDELFTIRRSIIPKGLHILGQPPSEESLVDFVTFVLRYDRGEIKSLHRVLASSKGIDYNEMMHHPEILVDGKSYAELAREIEERARETVALALSSGVKKTIERLTAPKSFSEDAKKTLNFGVEVAQNLSRSDELGSLLRGLSGKYITPNIGGDPIRSPEVLPTGSNTYQFDPRLVPSDTAYARGAKIAEDTLEHYHHLQGTYPQSVGVILWGFETMNTRGESVGQILRYIGVVPVRKNPWQVELKLIPLQELGRPRVDVVVNICGIFRDTFPNIIKLLDDAFNLVSSQEESLEGNLVKKHSQEIFDRTEGEIGDVKLAQKLATARIFGPSPSGYATSLRDLINSRAWSSEENLGRSYISDMQYAYTADLHGYKSGETFERMLSRVELTSQVRDSHDYEITDLDHYYEFSGGLAKAVEVVSGKKPQMLITDTTKELIKTEEIEKAIHRGVRTRLLNSKWIRGMLDEGYNGAQHIQERVENILGLAATTGKVDNWIWDGIEDRYILDEETRRRLEEVNPWALGNMIERLLEANKRGYWEASDDRLKNLRDIYLETEGWLEERANNE